MRGTTINKTDITYLNDMLVLDGKIQVYPFSFWQGVPENDKKMFMCQNACYIIPTTELIEFILSEISGSSIEIGSGNGYLGRTMGIPITDRKLQEQKEMKDYYASLNTPTIHYPSDVEELSAYQAIKKYNPENVIGCFITEKYIQGKKNGSVYGVEEHKHILPNANYISIGNWAVHGEKEIYKKKYKYKSFQNLPFLITRAVEQSKNFVTIHQKQ